MTPVRVFNTFQKNVASLSFEALHIVTLQRKQQIREEYAMSLEFYCFWLETMPDERLRCWAISLCVRLISPLHMRSLGTVEARVKRHLVGSTSVIKLMSPSFTVRIVPDDRIGQILLHKLRINKILAIDLKSKFFQSEIHWEECVAHWVIVNSRSALKQIRI